MLDVQKLQSMIIEVGQSMANRTRELSDTERLDRIEKAIEQLAEVQWQLLSEVNAQSRFPR